MAALGPEVRVRQTPSGPQLQVDGKAVPPRMFWGRAGTRRLAVGADWQTFELAFTPGYPIARAHVEMPHDQGTGLLEVRNARYYAAGGAKDGVSLSWVRRVEKASGVFTARDGGFSLDYTASWPRNGQDPVRTTTFSAAQDKRARIVFEARATGSLAWIRPYVSQDNADGAYCRWCASVPLEDASLDTLDLQTRKAAEAGVDFISFYVAACWTKPGEENWSDLDFQSRRILKANPRAMLVPRVFVDAPAWWIAEHPDHRMVLGNGKVVDAYVTPSSREYRRDAADFIRRCVRHMMETFPENFAGFHFAGQNSCEWFYYDSWRNVCGYDPVTRAAWRAYLAELGDPEAATAEVPTQDERTVQPGGCHLVDPKKQARLLLFHRFLQKEMADCVGLFAQAAREASEGRKLVVGFYGYTFELAGMGTSPAASGSYGLGYLLKKYGDALDILSAPVSYGDRGAFGSSATISAAETVSRAGVLWVNEDDLRTHLDDRPLTAGSARREGGTDTPEETYAAIYRTFASEAVRGNGCWLMDLCGSGWFEDDVAWKAFRDVAALDRRMLARTRPYSPEVALIADEDSLLHVLRGGNLHSRDAVRSSRYWAARIGSSYGAYLLDDVLARPIGAKLQIFTSAYALDARREKLLARLGEATPDATRLWCWATGLMGPDGASYDRMRRVTGFGVRPLWEKNLEIVATAVGRAQGLPARLKAEYAAMPQFAVEATEAETWARWSDGSAAIAVRPRATGRGYDVFCAFSDLSPAILRACADLAGVKAYLPKEKLEKAITWGTDEALLIEAKEDGTYPVTFGGCCRSLQLKAGEVRVLMKD